MGYDALPKVDTRGEMHEQLELAISNIGEEKESEEDFEGAGKGKKYLKSLFIESNIHVERIRHQKNIEIIPTNDPTIKLLKVSKNNSVSFSYLDTLDPRFWILYSLDKGIEIKKEIADLIQHNNSHLDYTWFSSSSLQELSKGYSKTNFSMRFSNYFQNKALPMKRLTIRLWAEDASEIIENLIKNEYIGKGACLSNIEINYINEINQFIKTRLGMDGSVNISKGNSLERLIEYQAELIQGHYRPLIETIERDYRMQYRASENGINIKGNIISIRFTQKLDNLSEFCSNLLKGTYPFRFSGFASRIEDEDYLLNIIDLHNSRVFDMEVFPNEILINLPKDACGNSVIRLFALCQERVDPRAKLQGGDGRVLLAAQ